MSTEKSAVDQAEGSLCQDCDWPGMVDGLRAQVAALTKRVEEAERERDLANGRLEVKERALKAQFYVAVAFTKRCDALLLLVQEAYVSAVTGAPIRVAEWLVRARAALESNDGGGT